MTFQQHPVWFMRRTAGSVGAIGLAPGGSPISRESIYLSRRPALSYTALGLKSFAEWRNYRASGKKPVDIPSNPNRRYARTGWVSYGDWLGTGEVATRLRQYRSFTKARAFVCGLGLKSTTEWYDYCNSGKKPNDIPSNPNSTYKEAGWSGMGDWLGTGKIAPGQYRSFAQARGFSRSLGFKSEADWRDYCKSGRKPNDIPAKPQRVYSNGGGWLGLGDWLGTGIIASRLRQYRSFEQGRSFARGLGLKSNAEWRAYNKSDKRPSDIPATPDHVYAKDGWAGWGDWLGYERKGTV